VVRKNSRVAGEPSHFEVGVPDAARAKAFYGELFGWSFTPTTGENAWIETPGVRGGLHDDDEAANTVLFFAVEDIEAAVMRVRQLGGTAAEPGPAETGGRFASCRDDQGVEFGLHQPESPA
jgi:predicted enzyme related to lactoylglutathione lyase